MNIYIKTQIQQAISMSSVLKQSCELAAKKEDGAISRDEAKILKRINEATDKYIKELSKIIEKD